MTITAVRQIVNAHPTLTLRVRSFESGQKFELAPGGSVGMEMWIPWANNDSEFMGHHLQVEIPSVTPDNPTPTPLVALWQRDKQVCFSWDVKWHREGECVPVNCTIGGDRLLTLQTGPTSDEPVAVRLSNLP